jgi:hypothetical protein
MLASHRPRTFMRAHRNDAVASQHLLSTAVALIETSEHALAMAMRLLRSVPNADVQMVHALQLTGGHPGRLCEQVVENDW